MVLVVALLVLGPQKLPDAARSVGRAIGEVRRYTTGFQNEMRDAFAEPAPSTRPPPATAGETPGPADGTADTAETADTAVMGPTATSTGETAIVAESTDVFPASERPTVRESNPLVTDNGETPSA